MVTGEGVHYWKQTRQSWSACRVKPRAETNQENNKMHGASDVQQSGLRCEGAAEVNRRGGASHHQPAGTHRNGQQGVPALAWPSTSSTCVTYTVLQNAKEAGKRRESLR